MATKNDLLQSRRQKIGPAHLRAPARRPRRGGGGRARARGRGGGGGARVESHPEVQGPHSRGPVHLHAVHGAVEGQGECDLLQVKREVEGEVFPEVFVRPVSRVGVRACVFTCMFVDAPYSYGELWVEKVRATL